MESAARPRWRSDIIVRLAESAYRPLLAFARIGLMPDAAGATATVAASIGRASGDA